MIYKPSINFLKYKKITKGDLMKYSDKLHNLLNGPQNEKSKMSSTIKIIIYLQIIHLASEIL